MNERETGGIEWGRWAERGVIIAVAAYFVLFHGWNQDAGHVDLVFLPSEAGDHAFRLTAPLMVTGAFIAGFLVAALLTIIGTLQRARLLRKSQRRIAELELEVGRLRNLPIDEDLHAPPEPTSVPDPDAHDGDTV